MLKRLAARLRRHAESRVTVMPHRDTDADWELIGQQNPYFGVLTLSRFKTENLDEDIRAEFFQSGQTEIRWQFEQLKQRFPDFDPKSALDFGCGVGRLTRPLGELTGDAVGIDVSESMLAEARRQAPENITFTHDIPDRKFDWLMSLIVFQHIPPERGYLLLSALIKQLAARGCITLQFVIYRDVRHARIAGGRITMDRDGIGAASGNVALATLAPGEMVMFDYDLSVIMAILFAGGVENIYLEHTDHGGFHGVVVRGRKRPDFGRSAI